MGYTKVVKSGDILEIYEYENELPTTRNTPRKKRKYPRVKGYRNNNPANARRKKQSFRRLVTANIVRGECPALFTLTDYAVRSVHDSWGYFTSFIERLRKAHGKSFRYIAVIEFQTRGAVHFHVLIWGLNEEQVQREGELRYYQSLWQRGFLDCIVTDGQPKLIGYLSKYMSKALHDERLCGQKAYVASRNIMRSVSLSFKTAVQYSQEAFGVDLSTDKPHSERQFRVKWLGYARYRLFKLNDEPILLGDSVCNGTDSISPS